MNYNSGNKTFSFLEVAQELLKPLKIINSGERQLIIKSIHYFLYQLTSIVLCVYLV